MDEETARLIVLTISQDLLGEDATNVDLTLGEIGVTDTVRAQFQDAIRGRIEVLGYQTDQDDLNVVQLPLESHNTLFDVISALLSTKLSALPGRPTKIKKPS
jgi:hypothetical protein